MARKLRMEEEGGLFHVLNRGNYRGWVFKSEGAKQGFEKALFEACGRFGWVLHAFCIMGNHFHLAMETPRGNLSEGMRWLQATFASRFNRLRKESGRLFQGRFKSLAVEDLQRLSWLCHYIHLNPVRAKICRVEQLRDQRWSS
ncbi:MAG: transposase, partial [Candidatus Acidiferrales bacterium]